MQPKASFAFLHLLDIFLKGRVKEGGCFLRGVYIG